MYHLLSYLVYFHITYLILSCTFIYILKLLIYGTFVCFHMIFFIYYTFIYLLPVSSLFHLSVLWLITFYVPLLISFLRLCIYHVLFHVVATHSCYTFHSSFSYLYYHILSYYMLLSCTFHILSSCTIHTLHILLYVLILSYTLCFRILSIFFFYWFKANTFISYLYFLYYVNFYLIFHISRRSIRLILLLSYHILSYVFIYIFMCFHILYFSYIFLFSLLYVLYLFISFSCTTLCTFYILYSCTVHVLFSYTYIHVLFMYYFHIPIFMYCSFTIFIYLYSCTVHFIYCFHAILFI